MSESTTQNKGTDRCGVCGERVAGVADALHHYLNAHPRSDLLHDTLTDVFVQSECSECGDTFTTAISAGIDAKNDRAMLTVASNCDTCIENDPLKGMMVKEMAPHDVLDSEVSVGE